MIIENLENGSHEFYLWLDADTFFCRFEKKQDERSRELERLNPTETKESNTMQKKTNRNTKVNEAR